MVLQMLDEAGLTKEGRIGVTQPRRVVSTLHLHSRDLPFPAARTFRSTRKLVCHCPIIALAPPPLFALTAAFAWPQAALTVARRVAQEMGCAVGGAVGYRVRFEERMCRGTRIVYLTGPQASWALMKGGMHACMFYRWMQALQREHSAPIC